MPGQDKKLEIQRNIMDLFSEIKVICDSGMTSAEKARGLDDTPVISELTDSIFEKLDELRDRIFDLEELFEPTDD